MFDVWEQLENEIKNCNKCEICKDKKDILVGEGNINSKIMIICEGVKEDQENQKNTFTQNADYLMNMAFEALGVRKNDIYITNIIKCKTPINRLPNKCEVDNCINYLRNQVILIKPKVIMLLGEFVLKIILGQNNGIENMRGKVIEKKGIIYIPTYNVSTLLIDENKKIDFFNDIKLGLKLIK